MKVVLQVVTNASVKVKNKIVGKINKGYLLLVGIEKDDTIEKVKNMALKIINLRINKDENNKTNLNILQVGGSILSVSQFTLCASLDSRRPSFTNASNPDIAKEYYEIFNEELRKQGVLVETGVFKEKMAVSLVNDGPFTITLSM